MYPGYGSGGQLSSVGSPEKLNQLAALANQLPSFRAVNRNQSVWEGPAQLWDGRTVGLRITLPPRFPQERPSLNLTQPVQHPYVDQAGQIKFASLSNWTLQSLLPNVVQEALSALNRSIAPSPDMQPGSETSKAATAPTDFPELQTFSVERLSELIGNKEAFQKWVSSYLEKSQPVHVKALLEKGNIDLAQANIDREGEVAEVKNQIAIIRSSEYAAAKEAFDTSYERQDQILKKINPNFLMEALGKKASEADDDAEELHNSFLNGGLTVEAFVPAYTAKKKLFHQRELKQQAAQQIL